MTATTMELQWRWWRLPEWLKSSLIVACLGLSIFTNNYRPPSGGGTTPVIADHQIASVVGGTPANAISITFGAAVSAGQLIVLAVTSGFLDGVNVIATPLGFTQLFGDGAKFGWFYKIATGSEGATFTINGVDQGGVLIGLKITGANASPIDGSNITASSFVSPSVSPAGTSDLLLSFLITSRAGAGTQPTGWTFINGAGVSGKNGGPLGLSGASLNLTASGPTGTATWTDPGTAVQVMTIAITS